MPKLNYNRLRYARLDARKEVVRTLPFVRKRRAKMFAGKLTLDSRPRVKARFVGICAECGNRIGCGELIVHTGKGWSHEHCPRPNTGKQKARNAPGRDNQNRLASTGQFFAEGRSRRVATGNNSTAQREAGELAPNPLRGIQTKAWGRNPVRSDRGLLPGATPVGVEPSSQAGGHDRTF